MDTADQTEWAGGPEMWLYWQDYSRPCSLISWVLLAQIWRQQPPCNSLYITYYFMGLSLQEIPELVRMHQNCVHRRNPRIICTFSLCIPWENIRIIHWFSKCTGTVLIHTITGYIWCGHFSWSRIVSINIELKIANIWDSYWTYWGWIQNKIEQLALIRALYLEGSGLDLEFILYVSINPIWCLSASHFLLAILLPFFFQQWLSTCLI